MRPSLLIFLFLLLFYRPSTVSAIPVQWNDVLRWFGLRGSTDAAQAFDHLETSQAYGHPGQQHVDVAMPSLEPVRPPRNIQPFPSNRRMKRPRPYEDSDEEDYGPQYRSFNHEPGYAYSSLRRSRYDRYRSRFQPSNDKGPLHAVIDAPVEAQDKAMKKLDEVYNTQNAEPNDIRKAIASLLKAVQDRKKKREDFPLNTPPPHVERTPPLLSALELIENTDVYDPSQDVRDPLGTLLEYYKRVEQLETAIIQAQRELKMMEDLLANRPSIFWRGNVNLKLKQDLTSLRNSYKDDLDHMRIRARSFEDRIDWFSRSETLSSIKFGNVDDSIADQTKRVEDLRERREQLLRQGGAYH